MAGNGTNRDAGEGDFGTSGRRKALRYGVPVAVAGVAAASIGIGTALASSGDPDLPRISAQDLIAKMAGADAKQLSGSVRVTTDLGLPSLPSGLSLGDVGGAAKGGNGGKGDKDAASPQEKLTELASGTHTLRVAFDGPDKQRVSIVERAAEYSVVRNGDQVWAYDSASNSVHHSTAPRDAAARERQDAGGLKDASPQELAKRALSAVDDSTSVTVDGTAKVAGRDAYQLVVTPKQDGTTVASARIAVDGKTGVPLKFTLLAKGGGKPVVDAGFTKVDFGKPAASTFDFTPPKGAKVTEESGHHAQDGKGGKDAKDHRGAGHGDFGPGALSSPNVIGKGWTTIAELQGPKGGVPQSGKESKGAKGEVMGGSLLDGFGEQVSGKFGSGRLVSTRIVNALVTDSGKVYVGAVTKDALVKAADAAAGK
ncbi:outer membrane lipoprotein carrier protein LolA [Streptomyces gamaensis]|uniref:Outer membrane lipoprotein carrier protein LolA n=1 Tax=Streptomyces gamaensis TaxID=1763542 RepID=A0ABW0Z4E3_9ACTN